MEAVSVKTTLVLYLLTTRRVIINIQVTDIQSNRRHILNKPQSKLLTFTDLQK